MVKLHQCPTIFAIYVEDILIVNTPLSHFLNYFTYESFKTRDAKIYYGDCFTILLHYLYEVLSYHTFSLKE